MHRYLTRVIRMACIHTHNTRMYMQVRSAISCCTLMEFTVVCSIVQALLMGLYPRGRKTAIFDVRVAISMRMRRLVTCGHDMQSRRSFLLGCIPLLQLAFAEYAYNFIVDYMPVEARALCINGIISTGYSTMCDQFRDRCLNTGEESWQSITSAANIYMDKLIRNMRMGPRASGGGGGGGDDQWDIVPLCTSSLPKKKRGSQGVPVGQQDTIHHDEVVVHADGPPSSAPCGAPQPTTHQQQASRPAIAYQQGQPVLGITSISSKIKSCPQSPMDPSLLDMHVCTTDNLHLVYPNTGVSKREMAQVHALHRRVRICTLPEGVAMEQQEALDRLYPSDPVKASSARIMYICSSCALAGKQVPLRPPMRYSLLNKRFTCLTCHRQAPHHPPHTHSIWPPSSAHTPRHRSQRHRSGHQQGRRDKGAKLTSNGTSILCIDMIGKVVYTSMDLPIPLWRCYTFCIKCARVHEVQDGPPSLCPLSQPEVTPACHSYHMMAPPCMPLAMVHHQEVSTVHKRGSGSRQRQGCCICVSTSSISRVEVMVRECEGGGMPVTYRLETRSFCGRHAPPPNLASAGCFIDDRQLMEFCSKRGGGGGSQSSVARRLHRA